MVHKVNFWHHLVLFPLTSPAFALKNIPSVSPLPGVVEVWMGDAAKIRAKRVRKKKTDFQTFLSILLS